MKRIISQCIKELAQFRRDKLTLALAFLLPLMTLLIYGFATRLESQNIPLVVQDFDHTNLSNSYIEKLYATNQFIPKEWSGGNPARDAIDRGIAKVAVIIPPQFSRDIKANKTTTIQVLIDATDVNNARVIRGSIQRVTNFFMQEAGLLPTTKRITARIRLWFNPGRLESLYIVPGVYSVILWIFPSLLTAIAMVKEKEKEKGTILQVYASGISATELLLGKGMAYLLIAITEALVVIGLGGIIFKLSVVNNPITLLLGTLIFLMDSVMFGLLVGVRSNNQNSAVQIISLVGFITSLLFSGFIYPLNNIPFPLSLVTNVVPARYYINITRDAFLRGTGWSGVWFDFLMLTILGLIFFNVSRRILSKMQISD
jgi:ABC-2 type transport system permease protein